MSEIDIALLSGNTTVVGFGKVPLLGDFVRVRSTGEPMASFESWVAEAMASGEDRRGSQWATAYGSGAIHAFVYRAPKTARSTSVLAGVLRSSHDAVGRKFPLVICAPIVEQAIVRGPHLLPLVLGDFLEGATHALMNADGINAPGQFEDLVNRVHAPRFDSADAASGEYGRWIHQTALTTAWGAIYGEPYPSSVLHALYTIIEAIRPFRGQETPGTPLSVRLPLGVGGAAAAAFWLDIVRSAAGWKGTVPSCFWHFDGNTGSILIQLGETPLSTLVELWAPDPQSDHVCDLTLPTQVDAQKTLARLPPPVAEVLQRPEMLVSNLLEALTR